MIIYFYSRFISDEARPQPFSIQTQNKSPPPQWPHPAAQPALCRKQLDRIQRNSAIVPTLLRGNVVWCDDRRRSVQDSIPTQERGNDKYIPNRR